MPHRPIRTSLAAAVLALAACEDGEAGRPSASTAGAGSVSIRRDTTPLAPASTPAGTDTATRAPSPAAGANLTGHVEKLGERRYSLSGRVRGSSTVQITVEDDHDVLYGPVDVPVTGGAFRTEVSLEATQARTVYAYLSDPAGTRQWVVPIPLDSARVRIDARAEDG